MLQYGLESQNRYLRNAALFNLIVFLFNALISGLLLFLPQADLDYNIGYVRNLLSSLVLSPVSSLSFKLNFSYYLDGRTATVYITNVLLLMIKLYDTVNLTKISSLENKVLFTSHPSSSGPLLLVA